MRSTKGSIYAPLDADLRHSPQPAGPPVKAGDLVVRRPITFTDSVDKGAARKMSGTAVYVHPKG